MTPFLDFFTPGHDVGGPATGPILCEGDGTRQHPLTLTPVPIEQIPTRLGGRDLLFATHGFNVSRSNGAASLGWLDRYFALDPPSLFVGILWPGDAWLPIVDYPFEGSVAITCGKLLATFCNDYCQGSTLSFASHSLGARLVLQAITLLEQRAKSVCLTAAAINRDCLHAEYTDAVGNLDRVAVLASHHDEVLKLAFSLGDPFADLLHDDHTPFQTALGYGGPPASEPQPVGRPWQIPDYLRFGHHNYLPSADTASLPPPQDSLWPLAANFIRRAFFGQSQTWPPP
jgi:Alpha/beta hydrolase of unknown function (DUF900)